MDEINYDPGKDIYQMLVAILIIVCLWGIFLIINK